MQDNVARMIGTVGVWLSVSIILAFGICRMNWNGEGSMIIMLLIITAICIAATQSTKIIWNAPMSIRESL